MTHFAKILLLASAASALLAQKTAPPVDLSRQLPISTRIDVRQSDKWVRGSVSEDKGPAASAIGVRIEPNNKYIVVPRSSIRLAARPAHISVGDHFEWYDSSVYKYVPAFVKALGTGSNAGSYLMAWDSKPESGGMYSGPENLFLPIPASESVAGSVREGAYATSLSQQLPVSTRIDIRQGNRWIRGNVSEDDGPAASTIKVRTEPDNTFAIVPRNSIRLAPRPATISIGDHFDWYDSSVFKYVPAFVKDVGTGRYAGNYLMVYDAKPNSGGMYSKPENLYLPLAAGEAATAGSPASGIAPALGKYRCYAYGAPGAIPILLGEIDLRAGGTYSGHNLEGRYSYDAATSTLNWASGWMKINNFGGKVESNALFRIARTSICTHE